jgi:hypothetical protein
MVSTVVTGLSVDVEEYFHAEILRHATSGGVRGPA